LPDEHVPTDKLGRAGLDGPTWKKQRLGAGWDGRRCRQQKPFGFSRTLDINSALPSYFPSQSSDAQELPQGFLHDRGMHSVIFLFERPPSPFAKACFGGS